MNIIGKRISEIKSELPLGVQLVAISKYHPAEMINEAYDAGQRIFGESHVQELQQKQACLPSDIKWHFIGHLQTNKVKYIVPYISLIHAVDSYKLLQEINKQAQKYDRIIPCLLQIHVATEETKFGFTPMECMEMMQQGEWRNLLNVKIKGIMCMASNVDDINQIRNEFRIAYHVFEQLKKHYFADNDEFCERSWGMSHDYKIAIEEGSTMVRIGSKIFGDRVY